jgi:signal transduction histidine kinase
MSRNLSLFSHDPRKEGIAGKTDLVQWCERAWRFLQASIRNPGDGSASIDLCCEVPKDTILPPLPIAPHRLTQIVQNLIHNARDAVLARRALPGEGGDSSYRGAITFSARHSDRHMILCVADDGIGMDDQTIRRCTEPFFTTRNRPNAPGGSGSGMGLALIASIVARSGGTLDIQSSCSGPQQGTKVTLAFAVDLESA